MARKTATVTITDEGRDLGKVFTLHEMPASQAEDWALRVFLALVKSGVEIPENVASAGLAGVASMGLGALKGMAYADAKPLLDEMMACVKMVPDPAKPSYERALVENDVEEVTTRLHLRIELFKLHTDFLVGGAR
jgi:hypothetical protein